MSHLSHRDYDRLLAALSELYACQSAGELPATALAICSRLIPNLFAVYTEIDSHRNTWKAVCESPDAQQALLDHEEAWVRHYHAHPVLRYYEQETAPEVRTISDFLTLDRWNREPLNCEFFRHYRTLDQMVVPAPKRNGLAIGVCLNRERRDFSRRDRLVADLLREHLFQAHCNVAERERLREQLSQWERGAAALGVAVLVITDRGRIVDDTTAAAAILLQRYFDWPSLTAEMLPQSIWRWARRQIERLRRVDDSLALPEALTVQTNDAQLVLQLFPDGNPSQFLIVAKEQRQPNPRVLCRLGLTRREADVLWRLTQGHANAAIAHELGISTRTVHKHLERIFVKLNVTTRTEAALRAVAEIQSA